MPEREQDQGGTLETARECARHFLQPYIAEGWTIKALSARPLRIDRPEYAARTGPGDVEDHQAGGPRRIVRGELAITRIGQRPVCAVYPVSEIKAEIHDQQRDYRQRTLAEILLDQEEEGRTTPQEAAPHRRPRRAHYRAYMGGFCQNPACGEPLGLIEVEGGRARHYCDNNGRCRVAAHRARKSAQKRAAILQFHGELREFWHENHIEGELLRMLQNILIEHGKGAAWAASRAVLYAKWEQVQLMGLAHQYPITPPRLPRS